MKPTDSRAAPDAPGASDQRSDASTALLAMAEGSPECIVVVRAVRSAEGIHCGDAVVFANAAFQRFWLGDDPAVSWADTDLFATAPALAALREAVHDVAATREPRTSNVVVRTRGAAARNVGAVLQPWGDGVLITLTDVPALSTTLPRETLGALGDLVLVLQAIRDETGSIVDEEIAYANPAWQRAFLGPGADDPTGRRLLEAAPSLAARLEMYKRVITTGIGEQAVVELDGHPGWFETRAVRLGDGVVVLVRDVTEQRRARVELTARELELAEAQRIAHVGSWTSRRDTGEVVWSDEVYRILGVPPRRGPLAAPDQAPLFDPETFAIRSTAIARLFETGEPFELEAPITQPGGAIRRVVVRGEATRDAAGVITGARGTVADVTDTRLAEAMTRESEARFRMIAEHASDVVFRSTPEGVFQWVSPSVRDVLGWTPDEAIGESVFTYIHPDDAARVRWAGGSQGDGDSRAYEARYRRSDGLYRWLSVVVNAVTDASGVVVARIGSARDIDAEHEALLALRASETRYEELVASIPLGVYVYRNNAAGDMVYDYMSPQAGQLLGIDPAAPLADPRAGFADIHPDDLAGLLALSGSTREANSPFRWEGRFIIRGETRRIRVDAAPTLLHDGWTRWHGILEDVTEQRAVDAKLRRLVTAVEQSDDAILITDLRGAIVYTNPAFEQSSGYAGAEVLGRNPSLLSSGKQDPAFYAAMWATLSAGKTWRGELQNRRKDGSAYIDAATITPVRGPDGSVTNYVAVQRDITEQKAALEELRRLVAAVDQAGEEIVVTDRDAAIVYVNPAFERSSGYARSEVVGRNTRILQSGLHNATFYKEMWATLTAGEIWRGELHNRRKDGTVYIEATTITPVFAEDGSVESYVAVQHDVTDQRDLEARLLQSQRLEAVGQLAGGVAHDFNNLLAVIHGYGAILLEGLPPGSPERQDAEQVVAAAERGSSLTRQLLLFSRRQALEPAVIDPAQIIDGLLPMLRRLVGSHVEIRTNHGPNLGQIVADPGGIEQVIVNLTVNARDAMPDGGMLSFETLNADPESGAEATGGFVRIRVTDTGMGMDDAVRSRIFEPFFTTKDVGKGTGLGLATVHGIVMESGGQIAVSSVIGSGTTFTIDLPRTDALSTQTSNAQPSDAAGPAPRGDASGDGETILLAEDEPAVRVLLGRVLRGLGYRTLVASSGDEALALAAAHGGRLDALVSDVQMPGIQGPELARRLRTLQPGLPVVLVSGFTGDHLMGGLGGLAGVDVLEKPFTTATLGAAVKAAIDAGKRQTGKG